MVFFFRRDLPPEKNNTFTYACKCLMLYKKVFPTMCFSKNDKMDPPF